MRKVPRQRINRSTKIRPRCAKAIMRSYEARLVREGVQGWTVSTKEEANLGSALLRSLFLLIAWREMGLCGPLYGNNTPSLQVLGCPIFINPRKNGHPFPQ